MNTFGVICPRCKRKTGAHQAIKRCRQCVTDDISERLARPKVPPVRSADHVLAKDLGISLKSMKRLGGSNHWNRMSEEARAVLLNMTKRRTA